MLKDRDIASDCIEMHKHGAIDLTRMALECFNPQLRQTFITMRNKAEQSQNELSQMATSKGWYIPSQEPTQAKSAKSRDRYLK
ncbi:MAG: spore coat protein [Bacillota bacterium]